MGALSKKLLRKTRSAKSQSQAMIKATLTKEIYDKVCNEYRPRLTWEMLIILLGFLRCERKFGEKRLREFLRGFNTFADTMRQNDVTLDEITGMLKEECKFDPEKEYVAFIKETQGV
ncbi:MAG: hypothetical protein IKN12_06915 [Selenomonadaceae bacterium]|nr:hypothetical protein [Selenomonadaceae bacterium]